MKKFAITSMMLLVLFLSLNLKVIAISSGEAYYIVTNPGADMSTEININWHSDIEGTFVEYTLATDTNFDNATRVDGQCSSFSVDNSLNFNGKTIISTGFNERNQCKVSITGLTPDTEYMYRVGKTTFSDNYYFKTGIGSAPFSFLYLTDPQYASSAGADVFNNLMTKALEIDDDIRFSVFSGDVVDRGGDLSQWDILFQKSNLKNMPISVIPGNHEYYDDSTTPVFFDATYFNGFYNNPDNGAIGVENSSYYFKYNNVLVVGLDSEAAVTPSLMTAQKEWFSNVMENNHAQYIVVFQHRSFYGSQYASVSPTQRMHWQPLFDKYGVDIVLSGHDHVYTRTVSIYDGVASNVDKQGTVYLIGGSAGKKYYSVIDQPDLFAHTFEKKSSVTIFSVDSAGLHLNTIGETGLTLDQVTIPAKRSATLSSNFDKDEFMNDVTIVADSTDRSKATFTWGSKGYGYVNSVKIVNEDDEEFGYDYINTNFLTSLELTDLDENAFINYTLKAEFKDGTSLSQPITLSTKLSYGTISNLYIDDTYSDNVTFNWFANLQNDQVWKYNVYVNDELYSLVPADQTSIQMNDLNTYHLNEIRLDALDNFGDVIFSDFIEYGEEAEAVDIAYNDEEIELTVGNNTTPLITITPNQSLDFVYSSSNENVATVDSNGKITAVSAGQSTITVVVEGRSDVTTSITVNVVEETNNDTPIIDEGVGKKGCSLFSSSMAGLSFLSLVGVTFIFRKRKY